MQVGRCSVEDAHDAAFSIREEQSRHGGQTSECFEHCRCGHCETSVRRVLLEHRIDGDRGPGLGAIFVGEHGKIEINRNRVASNPAEIARAPENPGPGNVHAPAR